MARFIDATRIEQFILNNCSDNEEINTIYGEIINAPSIDLVRCGECKHMRKYALRSDEPTGIWCHRWSVPRLVTDDDFCSYGERRADGNKRRII